MTSYNKVVFWKTHLSGQQIVKSTMSEDNTTLLLMKVDRWLLVIKQIVIPLALMILLYSSTEVNSRVRNLGKDCDFIMTCPRTQLHNEPCKLPRLNSGHDHLICLLHQCCTGSLLRVQWLLHTVIWYLIIAYCSSYSTTFKVLIFKGYM